MIGMILDWIRNAVGAAEVAEVVRRLNRSIDLFERKFDQLRPNVDVEHIRALMGGDRMIYVIGTADIARAVAADLCWRRGSCVTVTAIEIHTQQEAAN